MKTKRILKLAAALLLLSILNSTAFAQGTAFTYQGRLNNTNGVPASGSYDFQFGLWSAVSGPSQIGGTLTSAATAVSNGLFTVTLDFGNQFPGAARWLEIGVRTNGGGSFATLTPRQQLTPSPYAITASNLTGNLAASQLTGMLPSAQLSGTYSGAVTLNNAGNQFSGAFTGNGANVTNVNALTLGGLGAANFWQTSGNAGTTAGVNFVGTTDNQPLELRVNGNRALRLEPSPGGVSVIGGSANNQVATYAVTIGGGDNNTIQTNAYYSTIGGGRNITIQTNSAWSTIAGGDHNTIQTNALSATIGGGERNLIGDDGSTIAGGSFNTIQPGFGYSTICGGTENTIQTNADLSTIGGGQLNMIQVGANLSTIGGGTQNTIQTTAQSATIGGGFGNTIQTNAYESTIGGGYDNTIGFFALNSTIGGGTANTNDSASSTIGGGENNTIQPGAGYSTIGGGYTNTIWSYAQESTIGGGTYNTIQTNAYESTIAGGTYNTIQTNADRSAIGGGYGNMIQANAMESAIVGGKTNLIQSGAYDSTIGGGYDNQILNGAYVATLSGGTHNRVGGAGATIPGGNSCQANGVNSFAAGTAAWATNNGSFVWADSSSYSGFSSTTNNQFSIRASGGVVFTSGSGGANQNVAWTPGSGSWSFTSDRNAKENFKPVDAQEILDKIAKLPMTEWNYKGYGDRHVGPMAQDFHAAFPFNANDQMINSADEAGVSLAAIQGLNQKVEEERSQLEQKQTEITELKQRLEKLEELVNQNNGGAK